MNADELKGKIKAKRKTQRSLAAQLGISERALSEKLKKGYFSLSQLIEISDYLKLSDKEILYIYFER